MTLNPLGALSATGASRVIMQATEDPRFSTMLIAGALLFVGVMARGAGLLASATTSTLRSDPAIPLLLSTGLAGAMAVTLFSHPGLSQWYLLRNAAPASAIGLIALWEELGEERERMLRIATVTGLSYLVVQEFVFRDLSAVQTDVVRIAFVRSLIVGAVMLLAIVVTSMRTASTARAAAAVVGPP